MTCANRRAWCTLAASDGVNHFAIASTAASTMSRVSRPAPVVTRSRSSAAFASRSAACRARYSRARSAAVFATRTPDLEQNARPPGYPPMTEEHKCSTQGHSPTQKAP